MFPVFFREEIFGLIAILMEEIGGKGTLGLISFIFLNNLKTSFIAMVLGVGAGIVPLVITISNGYLLGFVAREAVAMDGFLVMWKLLPHGIFELPAIIFSVGIGFKLGLSVLGGRWSTGKDKGSVGYNFKEGLRFFVFVVLPLLLLAGMIEGTLLGIV